MRYISESSIRSISLSNRSIRFTLSSSSPTARNDGRSLFKRFRMQALCVCARAEVVGVAGGLDRILGVAVGLPQRKGGSVRNGKGTPGLQEGELGRASTQKCVRAQLCAHHSFGGVWQAAMSWNCSHATPSTRGDPSTQHIPRSSTIDFSTS